MNPIEDELKALLAEKAEGIRMSQARHSQTLGRARRRRAVTGLTAVAAAFCIVAGGITLAGDLTGEERGRDQQQPRPATTEGETDSSYDFTATPGQRPVIASGNFRGAEWDFRGTRDISPPRIDQINLRLSVDKGSNRDEIVAPVYPGDDLLQVHDLPLDYSFEGSVRVVFGAVTPDVASVAMQLASREREFPAYLVTDYDLRSTNISSYFVVFVPTDARGWIVARDAAGVDVDREPLGEAVADPPGVVASGKVGAVTWRLEIFRRGNLTCFLFDRQSGLDGCFDRQDVEAEAPLLLRVFESQAITSVAGVLPEPARVRLKVTGERPVLLQPFSVPTKMTGRWLRHLVAVGLEPGTNGRVEVLDERGRVVARRRF